MTENEVKEQIIITALKLGAVVIRINSGTRHNISFVRWWYALGEPSQTDGISDILILLWGLPAIFVECKATGKLAEVSPAQLAFLAAVRERGCIGIAAEAWQDVEVAIREFEQSQLDIN